jgi:hypothetical protein
MKAIAILCTILLLMFNCTTKPRHKKPKIYSNCLPLFRFNEVIHYYLDVDDEKVSELWDGKLDAPNDRQLAALVADGLPNGILDSLSLVGAEKIGFTKVDLSDNQIQSVANLFCVASSQKPNAIKTRNCIPIWRDILVFKSESTIVGIAKVCFTCNQLAVTGKDGQIGYDLLGRYGKLARVLNRPTRD